MLLAYAPLSLHRQEFQVVSLRSNSFFRSVVVLFATKGRTNSTTPSPKKSFVWGGR